MHGMRIRSNAPLEMEMTATTAVLDPVSPGNRIDASAESPRKRLEHAVRVPRSTYARFGRAAFNATLVAAILAPLLGVASVIALANLLVYRDPRKVLFVQPRVGHNGRIFQIFKFRTMSEPRGSAHDSWCRGEDASRVTPFGRFLRNTHLDELPQMWNILKRDMDVIGPRPEMVEIEVWASEHLPNFTDRLAIRPGITGIAQITQGYTGHDIDAYAEKLAINLAYIRHMSLALDVEICLRTAAWVLRGKGWNWNRTRAPRR
jgi:lipopolysaccharide/colanic/teichoic acid biosynthesis glycosyltransferase